MPYISRSELCNAAEVVRELASFYATKGKGELPVDRIFFGYVTGRYGFTERQVNIRCQNKIKRIDYRIGGKRTGTFVELVVRRHGQEWQVSQNDSEMNKLLRAHGRTRALVVVDVSKLPPISRYAMRDNYESFVPSPGKFKRRHITIVYAGAEGSFCFGMRTGTAGTYLADD